MDGYIVYDEVSEVDYMIIREYLVQRSKDRKKIMPVVLHPDPFNAVLLSSPPLVVTNEQINYIKEVLDVCCSDSKFAEKAFKSINHILLGGNTVPPDITSLNPATAELGAAPFTLSVIGTGFSTLGQIYWNGSPEPTTYVSSTELTTVVDMSTAVVAVDIPVAVVSADGVMSNIALFSLTDPASGGVLSVEQKVVKPVVQASVKK